MQLIFITLTWNLTIYKINYLIVLFLTLSSLPYAGALVSGQHNIEQDPRRQMMSPGAPFTNNGLTFIPAWVSNHMPL